MMKYILFGAICLVFALLWLSSESRRKKAEAQLADVRQQLAQIQEQSGSQADQLAGMEARCDDQKTRQQACFEAACNIHLYAQLAAEEAADAAQKQKQQIILSETEKLLDLLKSDDK